ncbi:hypothetical protein LZ11_02339 [Thermosediminibacter litoriperuensis]|uniref:Uncharacterized protein n=1 Tax=Thermosediminibacter litoriperuensis TaxID=291989 RepID=A0A5S5AEC2_9FIRM|nr:hypothetical protein LZ11_02339 [Thermosediminibacter litoriperuensis]
MTFAAHQYKIKLLNLKKTDYLISIRGAVEARCTNSNPREAAAGEAGERGRRRSPAAGRRLGWDCTEQVRYCHLKLPGLQVERYHTLGEGRVVSL